MTPEEIETSKMLNQLASALTGVNKLNLLMAYRKLSESDKALLAMALQGFVQTPAASGLGDK